MYNEDCLVAIMLYLERKLVPDPQGKCIGIKSRVIAAALEGAFPSGVVYQSIGRLYDLGFISRTNAECTKQKPNVYKINGITEKGFEYLSVVKDDSLLKKLSEIFPTKSISLLVSISDKLLDFLP